MDRETVFTRVQERAEKVRDYFCAMQKLAKRIPGVDEDLLKGIIIRGLQPQIKAFVLQHQGTVKYIGDFLEVARVAETAIGTTAAQGDMSAIMDEIRASRAADQPRRQDVGWPDIATFPDARVAPCNIRTRSSVAGTQR